MATTRAAAVLSGALAAASVAGARADTPERLLARYAEQALAADPGFDGFSAQRGRVFYLQEHVLKGVGAVSCASCHRKDPREQIRAHRVEILCRACHVINDAEHADPEHAKKRVIEPFAPHANPERFKDHSRVEKYFETNCLMLLQRRCTPMEKGDLITWLLSVAGPAIPAPLPTAATAEPR